VEGRAVIEFPPQSWDAYYRHREDIAKLLDPRCFSIGWMDTQLLSGDAIAFGTDDAVIIVTVKQYPAGATELHGLAAAGAVGGILELIEQAEKWGRDKGLTFACISSRPAWARLLKARGYYVNRVEIVKDL
jgi:hypothetical protein